jgi:hypothetical protein
MCHNSSVRPKTLGGRENMAFDNGNKVALISAFIGGAFTIAAAIIGAELSGAVHISGSKPSPRTTVTVTAAPSGGTGNIKNPPAPASKGMVLKEGPFTLTDSYCVDLDSGSPNWGVTNICPTDSSPSDIRNDGTGTGIDAPNSNTTSNAFAPLTSSQSSSFTTCQSATDYVGLFNEDQLHDGLRFCVRTTAGNIALVQIKSMSSPDGNSKITFAAIVWKG